MLQLKSFRLQQRVDQVKYVESDPLAIDLGEDVADLVNFEVPIQLDVGNLVLLCDPLNVVTKGSGIQCVSPGLCPVSGGRLPACSSLLPILLIALHPIRQIPASSADDCKWKDVLSVLRISVTQELRPAASEPVVLKGLVVHLVHELVDVHVVEEAVRTIR